MTACKLLHPNQSGFMPGDSCIHQLISITHEIYAFFDANPSLEVRGVFLDISKAFNRVWHKGLIDKIKCMGAKGDLLALIESFLFKRQQTVVLNGQESEWLRIKAGVPQGSILGPLFFYIYINDLSDNLESNVKLFADDTSMFSVVSDPINTSQELNNDLHKVSLWTYKWKMSFNPDPPKQSQEVIFSRKINKVHHPPLLFNNSTIQQISSQKYLGIHLDEELTFKHHINEKINKAYKGIVIIRKLNNILPRSALLTIYRSFIRPHLDYGDVIYDQPENESFSSKIESVQYNASLAITGTIRGTSQEKLYQELGLESLRSRRWLRRMCYFYKLIKTQKPLCLFNLIPRKLNSLRHPNTYSVMRCRNDYFKNSFIPYVVREWNKLSTEIRSTTSYQQFRKSLLSFIKPTCSSLFSIHHPVGVKLLVRLRLGFSHLREHKFRQNFHDTLNPLCPCSLEPETTSHYLLHCHNFSSSRLALMNDLNLIEPTNSQLNETALANILVYGDSKKSTSENR